MHELMYLQKESTRDRQRIKEKQEVPSFSPKFFGLAMDPPWIIHSFLPLYSI